MGQEVRVTPVWPALLKLPTCLSWSWQRGVKSQKRVQLQNAHAWLSLGGLHSSLLSRATFLRVQPCPKPTLNKEEQL